MSSRLKLTPLSALMPQKGTATRPEQVIERAREADGEQAGEHVSNQAVADFDKRPSVDLSHADANTSELAGENVSQHARERVSELPDEKIAPSASETASGRVSKQASKQASKPAAPNDPAEYIDGPRSSVSFRMTERLKDRLRDYAHFSRRQKQDIMDQAVHEFLRREGY